MDKILFLDESGDHNLIKIDPYHPIFVLGGIVANKKYALGEMTDKVNQFKLDLFGTTNIILHTADFSRQRNGFEALKDRVFCENFYQKLNQLIADLDITIISCAVKKQPHFERYGFDAIDPYLLSLNVLVERFCYMIKNEQHGMIIAESRDVTLDKLLDLAWENLKVSGTNFMKAIDIHKKIKFLETKTKQDNFVGLEIADIIVTPIARRILQKTSRIDFEIIKHKMRKNDLGEITGYGLVILPKK